MKLILRVSVAIIFFTFSLISNNCFSQISCIDSALQFDGNNQYVKLGQVTNAPGRNEAEIQSETTLPDFGLLVTMEGSAVESPLGPTVGTIHIVP